MAEVPPSRREGTEPQAPSGDTAPPQSPAATRRAEPSDAATSSTIVDQQQTAAADAGPSPESASKPQALAADAPAASARSNTELLSAPSRAERIYYVNFNGSALHGVNFGGSADADKRYTWAEKLAVVKREDCAGHGVESDPVFAQACEALEKFRIVVLRHAQGCQQRAEGLLKCVSHWAGGRERPSQLLGVTNDFALPLRELAVPEDWPVHFRGSLVMLERRQEPMTTRFLSSNNSIGVRSLCERLASIDTRLIITLAAEWDSGEGNLDPFDKSVRTLEVTSTECPKDLLPVEKGESAFDAVPRIAAGLFQGLKVDEYRTLVDELALGLDPLQSPGAPDPADAKTPPPPPPPPTRLQRWRAGDVDGVLTELGVRYLVSSADSSSGLRGGRATGYFLADERSPYGEPGWVIAQHPALLAGRADRLLDRYLGSSTSDRYREAFLTTLARLEGAGVREVSADWLLQGWARMRSTSLDIDSAARNLCALVEYLQPDNAKAELARAVIRRLAERVVAAELTFQQEAGIEPLRRSLEALAQEENTYANPLWQMLLDAADVGAAARRLDELQTASLWALLRLSRKWPVDVARSMAKILADITDSSTPWRQMAKALEPLDLLPRFATLVLDHLLKESVSVAPELWTAFGEGIAQAFGATVCESMAASAAKRQPSLPSVQEAIDGQRLAFACLYSLAPRVYATGDAHPLQMLNLLGPGGTPAGDGPALIGRLLAMSHFEVRLDPALGPAGQGTLPTTDVVRFLHAMAMGLQTDKTLSAEQIGVALSQVGSGLRAVLPSQLRRDVLQRARESLESLFVERDHLETIGDRESLGEMRRRIRAIQATVRSLSAPQSSAN